MSVRFEEISVYKNCDEELYKKSLEFFKDILPDKETFDFKMSKLCSYIFNDNELYINKGQELFFYNGVGSNGKSKIGICLKSCIGEYYTGANPKILSDNTISADQASPSKTGLKNKKIIVYNEPDKKFKLTSSVIKTLCSNESFKGRKLYQEEEDIFIEGMNIIMCNKMPEIDDLDGGVSRRLYVINYPIQFVEKSKIKKPHQKEKKLLTQKETEDISWGLLRIIQEYYGKYIETPDEVLKYTEIYKKKCNNIFRFCNEYLKKEENGILKKKDIKNFITQEKIRNEYFDKLKDEDIMLGIAEELDTEYIENKYIRISGKRYHIRQSIIGYTINYENDNEEIISDTESMY
jgi:phage/plasmid-associated DNA primase